MKRFLSILLLFVSLCHGLQAQQMHKVKKKETLWSISKQYGVTVDDIVSANPEMRSADYKLQKGSLVKIPDPSSPAPVSGPSVSGLERLNVAVLLPFEATGVEGRRSVEFYRGLLMAAKVAARASGKEIHVSSFIEPPAGVSLDEAFAEIGRADAHLIFGPVYPEHFGPLSGFLHGRNVRLVVPFSSKVEEIKTDDNIVLLNTPDGYEWLYASRLLNQHFPGVVKVVRICAREGKQRICADYIARSFSERGIAVGEINADFSDSEMLAAVSKTGHTLFLPDCDDGAGLDKLFASLRRFRQTASGLKTSLIGFPSWQDHLPHYAENMALQDTYIFSANHYDSGSRETADFVHRYKTWCHADMLPVSPRMALLGYDAARFLFTLMLRKGAEASLEAPAPVPMLQSDFAFGRLNGGGYINKGIFLLHVESDGTLVRVAVNK